MPVNGASAANQRNCLRSGMHLCARRHHRDQRIAAEPEQHASAGRHHHAPAQRQHIGALEGRPPVGAHRLAAELLGRLRHAVEKKGADHQELQQDRIGWRALTSPIRDALRGKPGIGRHQRRRADHQIAAERRTAAAAPRHRASRSQAISCRAPRARRRNGGRTSTSPSDGRDDMPITVPSAAPATPQPKHKDQERRQTTILMPLTSICSACRSAPRHGRRTSPAARS